MNRTGSGQRTDTSRSPRADSPDPRALAAGPGSGSGQSPGQACSRGGGVEMERTCATCAPIGARHLPQGAADIRGRQGLEILCHFVVLGFLVLELLLVLQRLFVQLAFVLLKPLELILRKYTKNGGGLRSGRSKPSSRRSATARCSSTNVTCTRCIDQRATVHDQGAGKSVQGCLFWG